MITKKLPLPSVSGIKVLPAIIKIAEEQMLETTEPPTQPAPTQPQPQVNEYLSQLYYDVVDLSKNWQIPDIKQEDLLLKTKNEYLTIMKYRELMNANNEIITKKVLDSMIVKEKETFETRNINLDNTPKIPVTPVTPIQGTKKKTGLFKKNYIV